MTISCPLKGSYHALQLLAFWLSWMRARFTPNQTIQLSGTILSEMREWANYSSDDSENPEIKLARAIYDDFSREPASDASGPFFIGGVVTPPEFAELVIPISAPPSAEDSDTSSTALELKAIGNEMYRKNRYGEAMKAYSDGLKKVGVDVELQLALQFNIATVHWKCYEACEEELLSLTTGKSPCADCPCGLAHNPLKPASADPADEWESRRVSHLESSEGLCRSIIEVRPGYVKAIYRLASCLLSRDRAEEAYALLKESLSRGSSDASGSAAQSTETAASLEDTNVDMLKTLMRRCIAALVVKIENDASKLSANDAGAIHFDASLLAARLAEFKDNSGKCFISPRAIEVFVKMRLQHYGSRRVDSEETNSKPSSSVKSDLSASKHKADTEIIRKLKKKGDGLESMSSQNEPNSSRSSVQNSRLKGSKKSQTLLTRIRNCCTRKDEVDLKEVVERKIHLHPSRNIIHSM